LSFVLFDFYITSLRYKMATRVPITTIHITTNAADGTSSFQPLTTAPTKTHGSNSKVTYLYSTPGPSTTLSQDADLVQHLAAASSTPLPVFPAGGGSTFFILESAPNPEKKPSVMHRSHTIDYIYMLEGEIEITLDSSETRVAKKGEAAVLRAAWHTSRNTSRTEAARILCVCLGIEGAVPGIEGVDMRK
jgi:hypothetical protein